MPISQSPLICPLCHINTDGVIEEDGLRDRFRIRCYNCGDHWFSGTVERRFAFGESQSADANARIFYSVRRQPANALITSELIEQAIQSPLPGALERIDNLLIHLASAAEPGIPLNLEDTKTRAVIGAASAASAAWALREILALGYVHGRIVASQDATVLLGASLNSKGWGRFHELTREAKGSKRAFMAMQFGNAELDRIVREHFVPAVRQTGFELRRVDGETAAGSIDNRMRVEIRTSRFLVCDLTHNNRGAYWEAGFAEGIGRPVIYTCRRDVFNHPVRAEQPHFDINHHAMVLWEPTELPKACEDLKAMIRATLPADAQMEDGEI